MSVLKEGRIKLGFEIKGTLAVGDGARFLRMPAEVAGKRVVAVAAAVLTTSTAGTPTFQIARGRQAAPGTAHAFVDVLSTPLTIDANEYDSKDANVPAVINAANEDIAAGDILRVDVDVTGTGTTDATIDVILE